MTKKRNKAYKPKPVKLPMALCSSTVLCPIQSIINRLDIDGTVDTVDGRPVFNDGGDLYEIVPALDGLLDWIGLYAKKSGRHINLEPFEQLKQQLHFSMPIQATTFNACKAMLPEMQRFVALMPAKEALSNLTTVQISGKLHGKYGNDNRYTGAVCAKT